MAFFYFRLNSWRKAAVFSSMIALSAYWTIVKKLKICMLFVLFFLPVFLDFFPNIYFFRLFISVFFAIRQLAMMCLRCSALPLYLNQNC